MVTTDSADLLSTVDLLQLWKKGDPAALEILFARYRPRLKRWARGQVPTWARGIMDTEDLVSQTLLAVLPRLSEFDVRHQGSLFGYFRSCVLNQVTDLLRRKEGHLRGDETVGHLSDERPSPMEELLGKETVDDYERALSRLSPMDRELIVARIELRLPWAEVAEALGKSGPDAARVATNRAIARLVEEMAND